jgi:hypothetical protein
MKRGSIATAALTLFGYAFVFLLYFAFSVAFLAGATFLLSSLGVVSPPPNEPALLGLYGVAILFTALYGFASMRPHERIQELRRGARRRALGGPEVVTRSSVKPRAGLVLVVVLAAWLLAQFVARSALTAVGSGPPPRPAVAVATAFLFASGFSIWVAISARRNRESARPVVAFFVVWAYLSAILLTATALTGDFSR